MANFEFLKSGEEEKPTKTPHTTVFLKGDILCLFSGSSFDFGLLLEEVYML